MIKRRAGGIVYLSNHPPNSVCKGGGGGENASTPNSGGEVESPIFFVICT